jgi:hypothetical protein
MDAQDVSLVPNAKPRALDAQPNFRARLNGAGTRTSAAKRRRSQDTVSLRGIARWASARCWSGSAYTSQALACSTNAGVWWEMRRGEKGGAVSHRNHNMHRYFHRAKQLLNDSRSGPAHGPVGKGRKHWPSVAFPVQPQELTPVAATA